jgi:hypothetical protein
MKLELKELIRSWNDFIRKFASEVIVTSISPGVLMVILIKRDVCMTF